MQSFKNRKIFLGILWLSLCVGGFAGLNWYKMQPGPVGKLLSHWPHNIGISHDYGLYNIVLFAHPQCGCTNATMVELEKIIHQEKNKLNVKIFFYRPKGSEQNWSDGKAKKLASTLPVTTIYDDEGGQIARRFGALTSGQVMLYSPNGKLEYAGGITESRGHIGANAGSRAIASIVETGVSNSKREHAFGCALFNEAEMKEYNRK